MILAQERRPAQAKNLHSGATSVRGATHNRRCQVKAKLKR
jgi:hypothetical protein